MASFSIKVIRRGLALLGRLSPERAGRAAFTLFSLAPSRKPSSAKEVAALDRARPVMARAARQMLDFAGGQVVVHRFRPESEVRRRVLLVHGWGSQIAYLAPMVEGLLAEGAEVMAMDWPGHGASPGRFLTMQVAVRAVDAAFRTLGPFDAAIGHSFGGAALSCAAGGVLPELPARVAPRMVLIGAPSEMTWLFAEFGQMMQLSPPVQTRFEGVVEELTGRPVGDFDASLMLGALDVPILVIHAEDDKEVSAMHARRYAAAGQNIRLSWANGFGHRRIVAAPEVIATINGFLAEASGQVAA